MPIPTATPEQVLDAFLRLAGTYPVIKAGTDFYPIADLCPAFFPGGLGKLVDEKGFSSSPLEDAHGHLGHLVERGSGDDHVEFIVLRVADDDYLIQPFPEGS